MKTGKLIFKRKNNDRQMEQKLGYNCELWNSGTDINRNYGYLWGNDLGALAEHAPQFAAALAA